MWTGVYILELLLAGRKLAEMRAIRAVLFLSPGRYNHEMF